MLAPTDSAGGWEPSAAWAARCLRDGRASASAAAHPPVPSEAPSTGGTSPPRRRLPARSSAGPQRPPAQPPPRCSLPGSCAAGPGSPAIAVTATACYQPSLLRASPGMEPRAGVPGSRGCSSGAGGPPAPGRSLPQGEGRGGAPPPVFRTATWRPPPPRSYGLGTAPAHRQPSSRTSIRTTRWRPPLADLCTKPGGGAAAVKQRPFPDTQLSQTGEWLWRGTGGGGGHEPVTVARGGGGASGGGSAPSSCPRGSAACRRGEGKMDPNRIIQALKGTIDPKLRIAAENELNQVRGADGPGRDPPAACPAPAPPRLTPAAARHGVARPRRQGHGGGSGGSGCAPSSAQGRRGRPLRGEGPWGGGPPPVAARRLRGLQRRTGPGRGWRHPPPERVLPHRLSAAAPPRRWPGHSAAGPGGGGLASGGRAARVRLPGPPGRGLPLRGRPVLGASGWRARSAAPGPRRWVPGGRAGSLPSLNFVLNVVTLGAGRPGAKRGGAALGGARALAVAPRCWEARQRAPLCSGLLCSRGFVSSRSAACRVKLGERRIRFLWVAFITASHCSCSGRMH